MRDFYEMQMMMQMFGGGRFGGGESWLMVAFLAGLFAVMFWRPEALRHPVLFRWSCTLFALSVLVSPLCNVGVAMFLGDGSHRGGGPGALQFVQIATSSGPVLFGASMIFGFAALAPTPERQRVATADEKGPFD